MKKRATAKTARLSRRPKAPGSNPQVIRNAKRAATADQHAREWQQTFDAITDIVALISPDFRFVRVNRAGCTAAGRSESELVGQRCYETVHGTDAPIADCPCARTLKTLRPSSGEFSAAGRHYIATADPVLDPKGRLVAFTHTIKDITEHKQAEDELARQSRLATLGRVAGGLAHALRSPLAVTREAAERLSHTLTPAAGIESARQLAAIQREVDRAERLAAAISSFVERTGSRAKRSSLRRILNRAVVNTPLPGNVSVHLELPHRLPMVRVDEHRMVVVFDNLLANAAQAMPAGGTIGVFASVRRQLVTVAVRDTGAGIAPGHMERIFEPLFSTRPVGAGIGLAMCKTFVEADHGTIAVKSEPDKGTTVTVTLPGIQGTQS